MMWNVLVNDIILIVYRYIHQSYISELNREYDIKFAQHWEGDTCYFNYVDGNGYCQLLLNYRRIGDGRYQIDERVSLFCCSNREYKLPQNYVYSGVWWPKPIQIETHSRLNNTK